MQGNKTIIFIGYTLLLLAVAFFLWIVWPIKPEIREIIFHPGELRIILPTQSSQDPNTENPITPPSFQDEKRVQLEWIPFMRLGDSSKVRLAFIGKPAIPGGSTDIAHSIKTPIKNGEDIYGSFSIMAEARLDFLGVDTVPGNISGKVLSEGNDLSFNWRITPKQDGVQEGIAWFYLVFYPLNGNEPIRQAISAQTFKLSVRSLLGISSKYWLLIGLMCLSLGIFLLIPLLRGLISENRKNSMEKP
jgi:hypothetical protein